MQYKISKLPSNPCNVEFHSASIENMLLLEVLHNKLAYIMHVRNYY